QVADPLRRPEAVGSLLVGSDGVKRPGGGSWSKRLAGVCADNAAQLPSTGDLSRDAILQPVLSLAERTFQDQGDIQVMPDVAGQRPVVEVVKVRNSDVEGRSRGSAVVPPAVSISIPGGRMKAIRKPMFD